MPLDLDLWREELPPGDPVYLNNASQGRLPRVSQEAGVRMAERLTRPEGLTLDDYLGLPGRCRERVARMVGAAGSDIALVGSTSFAANVVASGLPLAEGDEIVVWRGEFPANAFPWLAQEARGIAVRFAADPLTFPTPDAVRDALGPATRVLALSWVSFSTGYRADLEAVGSLCREQGVWLFVDATQGVGALALDLSSLPVDLLGCSGHKWLLSPIGTGFLFVRKSLRQTLRPAFQGWQPFVREEGFTTLTDYDTTFPPDARRYEVGSPPLTLLAPFETSLDLILRAGADAIEERLLALNAAFAEELDDGRWRIVGPVGGGNPHASGIVSLLAPGDLPREGMKALRREGFYAVMREGFLRLSPHVTVPEEEMRRAARVLRDL